MVSSARVRTLTRKNVAISSVSINTKLLRRVKRLILIAGWSVGGVSINFGRNIPQGFPSVTVRPYKSPFLFQLDGQGDGFRAAETQRGQSALEAAILQRVNQRNQYPRAACT